MTFIARVQPSNIHFFIEAGETILDAALRQGFGFSYGCQQGICGTCSARLLQGKISYPAGEPFALEDHDMAANDILLCSAVPESDIVLHDDSVTAPWFAPCKKLPYRVADMQVLSHSIVRILLEPPTNDALYFQAGQYVEVYTPDNQHHPFSIANAPMGGKHIELHVKHTSDNAFSTELLNTISQRQELVLEGPFGRCIYRQGLPYALIFIAGGTGFTHSKALIEQTIQMAPQTPMHLFWGAKTPDNLYLNDLPLHWQKTLPHFRYTPTISKPDGTFDWQGHTTSLPKLVSEFYPDLSHTLIYASGPPTLVLDALNHVKQQGVNPAFFCSDILDFMGTPS